MLTGDDEEGEHPQDDHGEHVAVLQERPDPVRRLREDRDRYYERDAVPEAVLAYELPEPHGEHHAGGQGDHDEEDVDGARPGEHPAGLRRPEEQDHRDRLHEGQREREVPGVLRDLLLPGLALFGELLQARYGHGHQLHHDRRRDVRHDPQREHREVVESPAGEHPEKAGYGILPCLQPPGEGLAADSR
jgi:hypothetical protein